MMEPFERIDIQELPLSVPAFRRQVEDFLGRNGLRLEEVDLYMAVLSADGEILAGGGLSRDVIKCIAVSGTARSLGLSVPLVSRLVSVAAERGFTNVKVFTKPENQAVFESLGFRLLAAAPQAVLMENGRGLEDYCAYLRGHRADGVIVMNANPFTLGHRFLVEQASMSFRAPEGRRNLVVLPVKEDASRFPYAERLEMIRRGCEGIADVVEGSDYQISAATFPTYFLKNLSDASETQIRLDLDLFGRHIAPALGATVRFVGSEPADPLTARYNALMKEILPSYGVQVVEIKRLKSSDGRFVSASRVREQLDKGSYSAAKALTPASTWPFLMADLAERALRMELDAPLKPGLVGPDSNGAHGDMDYTLMRRSIAAIRPYFSRMALAGSADELRQLGIDAEKAMLAATGGVNGHRGAIFALGLAVSVFWRRMESIDNKLVMQKCLAQTAQTLLDNSQSDSKLHSTALSHGETAVQKYGVKGARAMALDGYKDLFAFWLPYFHGIRKQPFALQRTLVCLIVSLDDTCLIHRVGYERSEQLRDEASEVFGEIAHGSDYERMESLLKGLCTRYAAEGASPGGAADMLALTVFIDSLLS
ncbi:MAG: [Bacteroidales bacterium]|nr:[citrate (pro-3S)-lyase] ligase [Bacteroidales bacterium]